MENDVRVTVRLPKALVRAADLEAFETDRNRSWAIREALKGRYPDALKEAPSGDAQNQGDTRQSSDG